MSHVLAFTGPARLLEAAALPPRLPIAAFPFTVGRGKKADGRLAATPKSLGLGEETIAIISRAHALIEQVEGGESGFRVRDLGSVNGTWVRTGGAVSQASQASQGGSQGGGGATRLRKADGRTEHALEIGDAVCFGNKLVEYTLRAAPQAVERKRSLGPQAEAGEANKRPRRAEAVKQEPAAAEQPPAAAAEPVPAAAPAAAAEPAAVKRESPVARERPAVKAEPKSEAKEEPRCEAKAEPKAAATESTDAASEALEEETQCCVCIAPLAFAASLGCGHLLCWVCAHQLLTCGRTPQCPQCRQPANAADLRRNPGMDGIVEKLVAVRLSAEERAQWEERVEEGKKLEAEHRSAGAAAAGGGAAAAGARAAPYVQPPPPQPVVRRAQANLGIAVHLAPCGSPCEVCGGRGAAPNPRPGVVGEQLAAMLQITGLPAQSAAARPHTINQRLIGNRGRTFHLECADLKQLVKSTAERARPTAGAGAATTQVTVNIAADLAADAMGWQRAAQRGLVVASLRARLRAAAGENAHWWRCTQVGGLWTAASGVEDEGAEDDEDEEEEEEVWSEGEGLQGVGPRGGPRGGGRYGFAQYRRDSFINDDPEASETEEDEEEAVEDDDDEEFDSEEEEESDEEYEVYRRRGW